jgi:hypothetical protein
VEDAEVPAAAAEEPADASVTAEPGDADHDLATDDDPADYDFAEDVEAEVAELLDETDGPGDAAPAEDDTQH